MDAHFEVNDDTLYLPGAVLNCSNLSLNANAYNWNFGDGYQSQDENPWHAYSSAGIYELTLIALNDACPGDTVSQLIHVLDLAGITDSEDLKFKVYPNPAADLLVIEQKQAGGTIVLTDCFGRVVLERKLDAVIAKLKINDLSSGMYQLVYRVDGESFQKSIVKY